MEAGWFFRSCIPGVTVWVALYATNIWVVGAAARAYRALGGRWMIYSSPEEYVRYERLDAPLSKYYATHCVWGTLWLVIVWGASRDLLPASAYQFALGGSILGHLAALLSRTRGLYVLRSLPIYGAQGKLTYPRHAMLRQAAVDRLLYALMFLLCAGTLHSWFLMGGCLFCVWHARELHRQAKAYQLEPAVESTSRKGPP